MIERLLTSMMRQATRHHMHFGPGSGHLRPVLDPDKSYLLYVHIPFCEALCPFCSFHRVLLKQPRADHYFDALRQEIRNYHAQGFRFSDVYVGGGTPTAVPEQLIKTLSLIHSLFPVEGVSVETNPNHLDRKTLDALKSQGVSRLSVGVQSFDDALLGEMGRLRRYGSGAEMIDRLTAARGLFNTLNIDMIFNLPHQSPESLERDLDILTSKPIADQVSFYPLMGGTTTTKAMHKDMGEVTHDRERRSYELILDMMVPIYQPSTVWCFSRTADLVDEYIVDHDDYIGVGSGAFSYVDGTFYSNSFSINRYIRQIAGGRSGIVMGRTLEESERLRYELLIRLFALTLNPKQLRPAHPQSIFPPLWKELSALRLVGAVTRQGDRYRLTRSGMYYWLVMMREFLTGVNNFRDEMRAHIRMEKLCDEAPDNLARAIHVQ